MGMRVYVLDGTDSPLLVAVSSKTSLDHRPCLEPWTSRWDHTHGTAGWLHTVRKRGIKGLTLPDIRACAYEGVTCVAYAVAWTK